MFWVRVALLAFGVAVLASSLFMMGAVWTVQILR
jgi:hypothetical protein